MPIFRAGQANDLAAIAAIQAASPEAASWDPRGYELLVAEDEGRVVGFLVWRSIDAGEYELLNLAVVTEHRRKGVGRGLVEALRKLTHGKIFLEVRESNQAALKLYKSLGFQEVGTRPKYYHFPTESGIVMKLHS
jgi:[ribosomal protein S18]-alanine N-acetyltransferase